MSVDPAMRFTDLAGCYAKYRPGYPAEVLRFLEQETGLDSKSVIADIGSGTGISTALFLKNGNTVYGVEPNEQMRLAAEKILSGYKKFKSINGRAERTTLPDKCIDLIFCAQAFHWFARKKAKSEFLRILKKNGFVALTWNERKTSGSEFLKTYDDLLRRVSDDYENVNHTKMTHENSDVLEKFFGKDNYRLKIFPNEQILDRKGFFGRTFSCSYIPAKNHPDYPAMIKGLEEIYGKFNKGGNVKFEYETKVYAGRI
ncbi:MAG: class I SAM-dependent methyltransferase [Bacteroidetes bacterium]|nr:class I SAM-dependent methyltransferase [Bacteroidota bacterium]